MSSGTGFDTEFLDFLVSTPHVQDVKDVLDLDGRTEIPYMHFSLEMSRRRKLAWWVAWNIDSMTLRKNIGREEPDFKIDRRLPKESQLGDDFYTKNDLDRGHLARRADLLWGTDDEAEQANIDSFYFPNITPQMDGFNQSGKGGLWGGLENALLDQLEGDEARASVMAGPILNAKDPPYRDAQVPLNFWKVLLYRKEGVASAREFVLRQSLAGLEEAEPLDRFRIYRKSLSQIEAESGIDFGELKDLSDPFPEVAVEMEAEREIRSLTDVEW